MTQWGAITVLDVRRRNQGGNQTWVKSKPSFLSCLCLIIPMPVNGSIEADALKAGSDILWGNDKICKQTGKLVARFLWRTKFSPWVRITHLSDSFRNLLASIITHSKESLAQLSEKETQFLYRGEVRRNYCVYTFGQGTKLEIKRKYFFQPILHCF